MLKEDGFSLIEAIVSVGLLGIVTSITMGYLVMSMGQNKTLEAKSNINENYLEIIYLLEDACFVHNTINHPENIKLQCLNDGSCSNAEKGKVVMVNSDGLAYNSDRDQFNKGFYLSGGQCSLDGTNSNSCDYKIEANYTINCNATDCKEPVVELNFNSKFLTNHHPKKLELMSKESKSIAFLKHFQTFKNCQDAHDKGNFSSGKYWIDMDGFGGECPFQVYCKMNVSSAKALIINAPYENYTEIPIVQPPLTLDRIGRLDTKFINYLVNSNANAKKKVQVEVKTLNYGDLQVNLETPSDIDKASYVSTSVANCSSTNSNYYSTAAPLGALWQFYAEQAGAMVGFKDTINASSEYIGFSCNTSCSAVNICGITGASCCSNQLKGSVWSI